MEANDSDGQPPPDLALLATEVLALHELGHEINLHNNVVVSRLKAGVDPQALLRNELDALRSYGVPVTGTASHGDGCAAN